MVELTVEIVIGILFTGGVLTVEAIVAKVGQAFKGIASLVYGAMKLPVSLAGKTISGFLQALHWLYEFLAKGTDESLNSFIYYDVDADGNITAVPRQGKQNSGHY